ncbi:hypothetical protein Acsp05_55820 [Actinokineospora sp. NBRC 105648]|nr:hypothetical protein Acsp05_55820 [Actinokineospora sp. NBRC 105648]
MGDVTTGFAGGAAASSPRTIHIKEYSSTSVINSDGRGSAKGTRPSACVTLHSRSYGSPAIPDERPTNGRNPAVSGQRAGMAVVRGIVQDLSCYPAVNGPNRSSRGGKCINRGAHWAMWGHSTPIE